MRLPPRLYLLGLAICVHVLSAAQALPTDGPLPHVRAPKYPATKNCDPTRCICTPEAFVEAFLATRNLSGNDTTNPDLNSQVIPFPLCVGEHLVGRLNGGNVPPAVETIFSVSKYEFVAERNRDLRTLYPFSYCRNVAFSHTFSSFVKQTCVPPPARLPLRLMTHILTNLPLSLPLFLYATRIRHANGFCNQLRGARVHPRPRAIPRQGNLGPAWLWGTQHLLLQRPAMAKSPRV